MGRRDRSRGTEQENEEVGELGEEQSDRCASRLTDSELCKAGPGQDNLVMESGPDQI